MVSTSTALNYHRLEAGGFVSRLKARLGTACSGILHLEIVVVLRDLLRPDVLHDHLIRHVPRTGDEETPRPQMAAPAELLQVAELLHQVPRALPLDPLHQVAGRDVRRAGDEQVDVVAADVPLEDLDLQLRTDRPNDLAETDADVASQELLAVLRDPHQVQLDVEPGVGGPSVVLHPRNVLEVVA